jgi:hypothetical protein
MAPKLNRRRSVFLLSKIDEILSWEKAMDREPVRPEVVTYVAGTFCNLCVRAGPLLDGAPGEIRTPDPLLRRQMLYPAELRARSESKSDSKAFAAVPKIKSSSFSHYCVRLRQNPC